MVERLIGKIQHSYGRLLVWSERPCIDDLGTAGGTIIVRCGDASEARGDNCCWRRRLLLNAASASMGRCRCARSIEERERASERETGGNTCAGVRKDAEMKERKWRKCWDEKERTHTNMMQLAESSYVRCSLAGRSLLAGIALAKQPLSTSLT